MEDLLAETEDYRNAAEGRSARAALEYLQEWRDETPGHLLSFEPRTWESPEGAFKVKYTPDFGIEVEGVRVAVHIWNTMRPDLDVRMTYAALSLFPELYAGEAGGPQDFAVLSVPDGRLYRLGDVADQTVLAEHVMAFVENLIEEINDEIAPPPVPGGGQPEQLV